MLKHTHLSYWEHKSYLNDIDFLIVGAGIVGYSCAIHLVRRFPDARIVIIERGYLPSGASSKNAGFACFGSPTEIWDDLSNMPENMVWETVEKRFKGLNYMKELIGDRDFGFEQNGSWDLISDVESNTYKETSDILGYLNDNILKVTGENNVYSEDKNVSLKFGFKGFKTSFYNRLEAQIDTSLLNQILYQRSIGHGIRVLFAHEAFSWEQLSDGIQIETQNGPMRTRKLLICTNGFAGELIEGLDLQPARAQVLVTEPIRNLKIKGTFHYDMGYYYFRNIDDRILLGGGRNLDFLGERTTKMETTEQIQVELERLLREMILPDGNPHIAFRWAGIMGVGNTKKPIVRQLDRDLFCAVRMGGMGVAIGSLVGKELADMI